ncbi:MAG: ABC transporter transmembrane domain-containing protein, partial [Paracoccaceae bacterium]
MTDLLGLLLPRERRNFYILVVMAAISALLEASSIASILPLLSVLAQPTLIETNEYLAMGYRLTQADGISQFQLYLAVGAFVMVVMGLLLKGMMTYAITRFSSMREYSISSRLLQGYLHQPYEWHLSHHSAELSRSVLAEVNALIGQMLQPLLRLIASASLVLFLVIVLFLAEPVVATIVAFMLSSAYLGIYTTIRRYLTRLGKRRFDANAQRFRMTQEALEGVKYVKLRSLEDVYVGRFNTPARIMARVSAMMQESFTPLRGAVLPDTALSDDGASQRIDLLAGLEIRRPERSRSG